MTNHEYGEEQVTKILEVVERNTEILAGIQLPKAAEVRSETDVPELTEEQLEDLYKSMAELGFSRESDISLAEAGMAGAAVNIEGGKPNKIKAELKVALEGEHGPIVLTASGARKIGVDEKNMLGIDESSEVSELESAAKTVQQIDGFISIGEPRIVDFGYDPETKETESPKGQAVHIGYINEQPVYILEVSRSYYEDGKYTQPNAGELTILTSKMLESDGLGVDRVATITGGLYGPTRKLDIANVNRELAAEGSSLVVGMAAYGRDTMGDITGTKSGRPAVKQLISEVAKLAEKTDQQ